MVIRTNNDRETQVQEVIEQFQKAKYYKNLLDVFNLKEEDLIKRLSKKYNTYKELMQRASSFGLNDGKNFEKAGIDISVARILTLPSLLIEEKLGSPQPVATSAFIQDALDEIARIFVNMGWRFNPMKALDIKLLGLTVSVWYDVFIFSDETLMRLDTDNNKGFKSFVNSLLINLIQVIVDLPSHEIIGTLLGSIVNDTFDKYYVPQEKEMQTQENEVVFDTSDYDFNPVAEGIVFNIKQYIIFSLFKVKIEKDDVYFENLKRYKQHMAANYTPSIKQHVDRDVPFAPSYKDARTIYGVYRMVDIQTSDGPSEIKKVRLNVWNKAYLDILCLFEKEFSRHQIDEVETLGEDFVAKAISEIYFEFFLQSSKKYAHDTEYLKTYLQSASEKVVCFINVKIQETFFDISEDVLNEEESKFYKSLNDTVNTIVLYDNSADVRLDIETNISNERLKQIMATDKKAPTPAPAPTTFSEANQAIAAAVEEGVGVTATKVTETITVAPQDQTDESKTTVSKKKNEMKNAKAEASEALAEMFKTFEDKVNKGLAQAEEAHKKTMKGLREIIEANEKIRDAKDEKMEKRLKALEEMVVGGNDAEQFIKDIEKKIKKSEKKNKDDKVYYTSSSSGWSTTEVAVMGAGVVAVGAAAYFGYNYLYED